jgi:protein DJ-1
LKRHESNGKILAAVCAGPLGFKYHNIAHGTTVTSYPSVKDELVAAGKKITF